MELEAALTVCQDRKREGDRRPGDFEAAAKIYRDALNQPVPARRWPVAAGRACRRACSA